jgi:hypothetical protein
VLSSVDASAVSTPTFPRACKVPIGKRGPNVGIAIPIAFVKERNDDPKRNKEHRTISRSVNEESRHFLIFVLFFLCYKSHAGNRQILFLSHEFFSSLVWVVVSNKCELSCSQWWKSTNSHDGVRHYVMNLAELVTPHVSPTWPPNGRCHSLVSAWSKFLERTMENKSLSSSFV